MSGCPWFDRLTTSGRGPTSSWGGMLQALRMVDSSSSRWVREAGLLKTRDVLRRLEDDEWFVARTTGSHRILKHPTKKGIVVVAGHPSKDAAPGTMNSIWKQAELEDSE